MVVGSGGPSPRACSGAGCRRNRCRKPDQSACPPRAGAFHNCSSPELSLHKGVAPSCRITAVVRPGVWVCIGWSGFGGKGRDRLGVATARWPSGRGRRIGSRPARAPDDADRHVRGHHGAAAGRRGGRVVVRIGRDAEPGAPAGHGRVPGVAGGADRVGRRDGPGDDDPRPLRGAGPRRGRWASSRPSSRPTRPSSTPRRRRPSRIADAPNDPDYVNGTEWQLNGTWGINVPGAWNVTTGSAQVIVADTDTGIAYNDPDLYRQHLDQPGRDPLERAPQPDGRQQRRRHHVHRPEQSSAWRSTRGPARSSTTNGDGVITAADVLAPTSCRRLGQRLDPGRRHRAPRRPDRLELRQTTTNNPIDRQRPRHVHRGGDRRGRQQRDRGRRRRLERADHGGAVPRLLGQRHRRRGRRGDRLRGQPRRQGHQRQLGRQRGGSRPSPPRSSTPTSTA